MPQAPGWLARKILREDPEPLSLPDGEHQVHEPDAVLTGTELAVTEERPIVRSRQHPALLVDFGERDRLETQAGDVVQTARQPLLGVATEEIVSTTQAFSPALIILDQGQLDEELDDDVVADYVEGIVESAIGFSVEGVGTILNAKRVGRFVAVVFQSSLRRKEYAVILPVEDIPQPVAVALTTFWTALHEKAYQHSLTHQNFAAANRLIDKAVQQLQRTASMLQKGEMVFIQGVMQKERVMPGAIPKRKRRRRSRSTAQTTAH